MRLGNRKIYSLLVIACLLAAILSGCSGKTPDEAVNAPANEPAAEPAAEPEESGGTASQLGSLARWMGKPSPRPISRKRTSRS